MAVLQATPLLFSFQYSAVSLPHWCAYYEVFNVTTNSGLSDTAAISCLKWPVLNYMLCEYIPAFNFLLRDVSLGVALYGADSFSNVAVMMTHVSWPRSAGWPCRCDWMQVSLFCLFAPLFLWINKKKNDPEFWWLATWRRVLHASSFQWHDVTCQKCSVFSTTAVITWNLAIRLLLGLHFMWCICCFNL